MKLLFAAVLAAFAQDAHASKPRVRMPKSAKSSDSRPSRGSDNSDFSAVYTMTDPQAKDENTAATVLRRREKDLNSGPFDDVARRASTSISHSRSHVNMVNKFVRVGNALRSDTVKNIDIYQIINELAGKVEELEAKLIHHKDKSEELEAKLVLHKEKSSELEAKLIQLSRDNDETVAEIAEEVFEAHTRVPDEFIKESETWTLPSPNATKAAQALGVESSVGLSSGDWCVAYAMRRHDFGWYGNAGETDYLGFGCNFDTAWGYWDCDSNSYYLRAPVSWPMACAHCPTAHSWTTQKIDNHAFDMGVNYWRACL